MADMESMAKKQESKRIALSVCGDGENRTPLDLNSPFSSRELFREAGLLVEMTTAVVDYNLAVEVYFNVVNVNLYFS